MQIKNNYDVPWYKSDDNGAGVFNGDIGILTNIDRANDIINVRYDDKEAMYSFENVKELELAYAMTVHKSQGSEFPVVVMPVLSVPQKLAYRNLFYTALTRAKSLIVLVGNEQSISAMVDNDKKSRRYSALKYFIENNLAYPCFATEKELEEMREKQETAKIRPGYYGVWAKYRNLPIEEAAQKIKAGEPYIIRFKSRGNEEKKIRHQDLIKGKVDFPENDQDIVIIKADGLPTYHFAHLVDDHLMRTTVVIRGDEWLSSVPLHLQLFQAAGFKAPRYAHIAPLMKMDEGGKRKISKRKDPEAAVSYYHEQGIPPEAVCEYLLNIANSNFESWRKANPLADLKEFELQFNKMGVSGALFDMVKLLDISKTIISRFDAEKVYNETLSWATKYDSELLKLLENKEYALKIIGIERGNAKPRKDISKWSDVKNSITVSYTHLTLPTT